MRRIVIADDDRSIRLWIRAALEASGEFRVVGEAEDGAEALEQAVTLHPDAMIVDLRMPLVDGYTALVMLQRRLPDVRLVVHTADEDADVLRDVTGLGVPVVRKTGDVDPLVTALKGTVAAGA